MAEPRGITVDAQSPPGDTSNDIPTELKDITSPKKTDIESSQKTTSNPDKQPGRSGVSSYIELPVDVNEGSDEDEDEELDELDDLLDEFDPRSSGDPSGNTHGETSARGASSKQPSLDTLDDDFAKQLQQGMADLLKEMEESPEFQAQFDSLVQELDKGTGSGANHASQNKEPLSPPVGTHGETSMAEDVPQGVPSFHDTIARTMERMKESGAEIDTEMADSQSDDFLAEMLRQMQMATGRGGSDEDFSKMLMGMMEQLTNKEILYEPMKELDGKFPGWLLENETKYSPEEMSNFREQARLVKEIVAKFEQPSFSDASEVDREYIVERMQKMQSVGSPPAELLGDMGQGDGLPPDIENCPVQ